MSYKNIQIPNKNIQNPNKNTEMIEEKYTSFGQTNYGDIEKTIASYSKWNNNKNEENANNFINNFKIDESKLHDDKGTTQIFENLKFPSENAKQFSWEPVKPTMPPTIIPKDIISTNYNKSINKVTLPSAFSATAAGGKKK